MCELQSGPPPAAAAAPWPLLDHIYDVTRYFMGLWIYCLVSACTVPELVYHLFSVPFNNNDNDVIIFLYLLVIPGIGYRVG